MDLLYLLFLWTLEYSGNICEKDNPCGNGATCGYTRGGYIYKCPAGWEGDACDEGKFKYTMYPCYHI